MTNPERSYRAQQAERKAEAEAKRLMEADPSLTMSEAIERVLQKSPELYTESVR